MKATLIGAGYIATGLITNILLDLFLGIYSIASWTAVMSAMVMTASVAAYRAGKHEGPEVVVEVKEVDIEVKE